MIYSDQPDFKVHKKNHLKYSSDDILLSKQN